MQGFLDRFRPPGDNSSMPYVLVLLMAVDVVLVVLGLVLWGEGSSTPPFIFKRGNVTRKVTKLVIT
jgi:hypothetical protein